MARPPDADGPLVVLLHGRGSNENDIIALADHPPPAPPPPPSEPRSPRVGGYAWFANRGIGRPVAQSVSETIAWFRVWLDDVAPGSRPYETIPLPPGMRGRGALTSSSLAPVGRSVSDAVDRWRTLTPCRLMVPKDVG